MSKTESEKDNLSKKDKPSDVINDQPQVMPVLPLRDVVVYPYMVIPLFVGRDKSIKALEAAMDDDKQILLAAQKNASQDEPEPEDLYRTGTIANILQLLKLPDGTIKVLLKVANVPRYYSSSQRVNIFRHRSRLSKLKPKKSMSVRVRCLCALCWPSSTST